MDEKKYLRRKEAAAYLQNRYGVGTTQGLAKAAVVGGGPRFRKLGRYPIYLADDLDMYAASRMSRTVCSTSELAADPENSSTGGANGA